MSALYRIAAFNGNNNISENNDDEDDDNMNTDTQWISRYNLCCNVIVLIYFWIALISLFQPLHDLHHRMKHLAAHKYLVSINVCLIFKNSPLKYYVFNAHKIW